MKLLITLFLISLSFASSSDVIWLNKLGQESLGTSEQPKEGEDGTAAEGGREDDE